MSNVTSTSVITLVQTASRLGTTAGAAIPCPKELGNALRRML